jgi:hypothetical protein
MPVVTLSIKLARAIHVLFLAACLLALYYVSQMVVWLGLFAAFVPFVGDKPALAYLRGMAQYPVDSAVMLGMAGYGLLHWQKWMKEDAEEEAGR